MPRMMETTEGYYRWSDIVWNWAPRLPPLEVGSAFTVPSTNTRAAQSQPWYIPRRLLTQTTR